VTETALAGLVFGIGLTWYQLWPGSFATVGDLFYPSITTWCLFMWWARRCFVEGWKARDRS
jgi:hypothetical protein